ncbi:DUF222 domain-containing protein [Pseudonocardia petroleophila]
MLSGGGAAAPLPVLAAWRRLRSGSACHRIPGSRVLLHLSSVDSSVCPRQADRIERMFPSVLDPGPSPGSLSEAGPSGTFGLELDLTTSDLRLLSDADLMDAVVGFEAMVSWAAARQFAVLAEFSRRGGDGSIRPVTSAVPAREWAGTEVAMALTLSPGAGEVRLAQAIRLDGVLRPTRDLLEAGRLDVSRVRLILDRLAVVSDHHAAVVQERVLPAAPDQTWAQLSAALRRAILAVDPDGAAEHHQAAQKERRVDVFPGEDGMATVWARMSAPEAASSFQWLTRLARGMGVEDPRTLGQRRADLAAAALTGKLIIRDPGATDVVATAPVTPGKPLITVVVPHSTLIGAEDEPCEIAGYGPIPAHLARDVAADAVWRRLVTDPLTGAVLDHGRTTYRPPAVLADHVRARDLTCRAPGCRRAATTCELDHVMPWQDEGTTSEDNLVCLCTAHHDLKEQPGWQVTLHPDRSLEWTTPTGHTYRTEPHDHRPRQGPPHSARRAAATTPDGREEPRRGRPTPPQRPPHPPRRDTGTSAGPLPYPGAVQARDG